MRRRDLLAGAAALGASGVGAAYATGYIDPLGLAATVEPIELETIDAPGSQAGTLSVPERGNVTVLEFFATWCGVCAEQMEPMGAVYDDIGQHPDVQFLSVTNEPVGRTVTRSDVATWWIDHDGRWSVALDNDLALTEALDASGVPYTYVLDDSNAIRYAGRGYKSVDELLDPIERAVDGV
ncbi:TlpA family protein disulfide reductase [Natrialbaceae archaeon A-CW1-1]